MKKSIFVAIVLILATSISSSLFAQVTLSKTAGYDVKKNVKCRVISTETGFTISLENEEAPDKAWLSKKGYDYYQSKSEFSVISSNNSITEITSQKDAASGLPTGKRQHKPITITKEIDKSSPILAKSVENSEKMGRGRATVKDFSFTKRCGNKSTVLPVIDGECIIPTGACPDGTCSVVASWSCDTSNTSVCSVEFLLEIVDGVCVARAINQSGISVKSTKKK